MDWMIYGFVFAALLAADFALTRGGAVSLHKSLWMTGFYIAAALGFALVVQAERGTAAAGEYVTIFALEKLLSFDNLLVISLIFGYFGIGKADQHRALLWGIGGAIVFRMGLIFAGVALVERLGWLLLVFAGLLVWTGVKIMSGGDDGYAPEDSAVVRFFRRLFGPSGAFVGAVCAIEVSDIFFAVDSIPASFSVSQDAFVIVTANLFAVLGLRSLYHAVAHGITLLRGIETWIGAVLILVGASVFADHFLFPVPETVLMGGVFGTLGLGAIICHTRRNA